MSDLTATMSVSALHLSALSGQPALIRLLLDDILAKGGPDKVAKAIAAKTKIAFKSVRVKRVTRLNDLLNQILILAYNKIRK